MGLRMHPARTNFYCISHRTLTRFRRDPLFGCICSHYVKHAENEDTNSCTCEPEILEWPSKLHSFLLPDVFFFDVQRSIRANYLVKRICSKMGLFELLKLQHRKIQSATLHRIIKPAYYEAPVSNMIERENIAARENIKNEGTIWITIRQATWVSEEVL